MDRMLRRPFFSKCWLTKKVCFPNPESAMARSSEFGPVGWRAYRCNYCGSYHLTTK
jgi:hypothetical protein